MPGLRNAADGLTAAFVAPPGHAPGALVYTDPQPALGMQPQPPAKLQDQGAMVQLYSVLAWETTNYNTLT